MADLAARWLSRTEAAAYLSVPEHHLPRLVKSGKLPEPSYHLGPRSPRYDRELLDAAFGKGTASTKYARMVQEAADAASKRGKARSQAQAC